MKWTNKQKKNANNERKRKVSAFGWVSVMVCDQSQQKRSTVNGDGATANTCICISSEDGKIKLNRKKTFRNMQM